MASLDSRKKIAGLTAAVTATAAAGYYVYNEYCKRYPKYQEQLAMFKEVGRREGGSRLVGVTVRQCWALCCASQQAGCDPGVVEEHAQLKGPPVLPLLCLTQYEHKMLPPRLEMEKLEDDILKQVRSERTVPPGARCPANSRKLCSNSRRSALPQQRGPCGWQPHSHRWWCRCMMAWRRPTAAPS